MNVTAQEMIKFNFKYALEYFENVSIIQIGHEDGWKP